MVGIALAQRHHSGSAWPARILTRHRNPNRSRFQPVGHGGTQMSFPIYLLSTSRQLVRRIALPNGIHGRPGSVWFLEKISIAWQTPDADDAVFRGERVGSSRRYVRELADGASR